MNLNVRYEAAKFVVFDASPEYHITKEVSAANRSCMSGQAEGSSLNSLCGAFVGLVAYPSGVRAHGKPMPRLYGEPPPGLVLCPLCARAMAKRKGLGRLLSHLFHHWRGFRAGARVLGRRT